MRLSRKELRELSEDELADRLSKSSLSASALAGLGPGPGANGGGSGAPAPTGSHKQHPASQSTHAADSTLTSSAVNSVNASQTPRTQNGAPHAASENVTAAAAALRRQPHPPATAPGTGTHLTAGAHVVRDAHANESAAAGQKPALRNKDARTSFAPTDSLDPN